MSDPAVTMAGAIAKAVEDAVLLYHEDGDTGRLLRALEAIVRAARR